MKLIEIHQLDYKQQEFIRTQLWNQEYPKCIQLQSNQAFLEYLFPLEDKRHSMVIENEKIIGWLMDFIRDNQRYFAMIVSAKHQGKGIGSRLLNAAKNQNTTLTGWVIEEHQLMKKSNGNYYKPPFAFYEKHDFLIMKDIQLKIPQFSMVQIKWTDSSTL